MTDKQYADMTTIMMFCRHFADQMHQCMKNAGLLEQEFTLNIRVGETKLFSGMVEKGSIELEQSITDNTANYYKNRMAQRRLLTNKGTINEGRWIVDADPRAEEGSIPPMVIESKKAKADVSERTGSNSSKPYPVDGLWLSSRDDYSDVGVWE